MTTLAKEVDTSKHEELSVFDEFEQAIKGWPEDDKLMIRELISETIHNAVVRAALASGINLEEDDYLLKTITYATHAGFLSMIQEGSIDLGAIRSKRYKEPEETELLKIIRAYGKYWARIINEESD